MTLETGGDSDRRRTSRHATQRLLYITAPAAALGTILLSAPAIAQTREARTWTQSDAFDRAIRRAPDVQAAQSAVDIAAAGRAYGDVPLVGNPILGARAAFGVPNATEVSSYGVTLAIPVDVSGQRPLYRREYRWATREAQARLDVAVNDALGRARASYVELATADAIIEVTAGRAAGARDVLARARMAVDRGAATSLDVALAERELGEATADLHAARRDRDEAAGRFREALDLTSSDAAHVAALEAASVPPGLTREGAVRLAVRRRPEIQVGHLAARRFTTMADRYRAQYIGPLYIQPEVSFSYNQSLQTTTGVSLQWALPLLWTGQGERAVSRAQSAAAESEAARATRRANREAGTAWDVLAGRLAELETLEHDAIPALERTLEATERQLTLGATDFFRVLYARRELALVRIRAATASREAWRARVALERAIGMLDAQQSTGGAH